MIFSLKKPILYAYNHRNSSLHLADLFSLSILELRSHLQLPEKSHMWAKKTMLMKKINSSSKKKRNWLGRFPEIKIMFLKQILHTLVAILYAGIISICCSSHINRHCSTIKSPPIGARTTAVNKLLDVFKIWLIRWRKS